MVNFFSGLKFLGAWGASGRGTAEVVPTRGGQIHEMDRPCNSIVFSDNTLSTELVLTALHCSGILRTWKRRLHT